MFIGVPKEIKAQEYRVGLTPAAVRELTAHGHQIVVETGAGAGIGYGDDAYRAAGAGIAENADAVFGQAEMIVKVKEPQEVECRRLKPGQILFTYLHLAPDPKQAELLQQSGATAIAYETVTDKAGRLPLLAPMSEIAGRMSIQVGAVSLQKSNDGSGVLLGGVPGVLPGKVAVIGGGVVGTNAARMAQGLGAEVTILDKSLPRLAELDAQFGPGIRTAYATAENIEAVALQADLVIGAVLIPGATAPHLISRAQLSKMRAGSVLVDVAIDQGGCFETSTPTTHNNPTYVVDGVVHYCVANMPGGVPRSSTHALNNATLPYVLAIADRGWREALKRDVGLARGLNVHDGAITHPEVARALNKKWCADAFTAIGVGSAASVFG